MFNSSMEYTSFHDQFQNPNPHNPNFDQEPYSIDQFNNSSDFQIVKFLLSNEDEGSDENILLKNEGVSNQPVRYYLNRSSNLVPLTRNVKCKRELKKYKMQEELRFVFRTKTSLDFLDDGYKWRKYGKKMVKNNPNPRNYFKCSSGGCNVKKRVERDRDEPCYVITTYQGIHNHHTPNSLIHPSP